MENITLIRPTDVLQTLSRQTVWGTYFIQTWGCQMNEEDSDQLALYLQNIGFKPTESFREAHIVLLNTCSVRKKPEDKAFSFLGELAILKKTRPEMLIGVCGCMAQVKATEIRRRAPYVDFVIGTAQISTLPGILEEALKTKRFQKRLELPPRKGSIVTDIPKREVKRTSKLKTYVPIEYGCDKFCTFCIVPTTRGRERSRPIDDILEEIKKLVFCGTKEVTLLGQTVNSYGKNLPEGRVLFSELLWKVAEIIGLERIRYTSPYPRDFKEDLIQTIQKCSKVMEHVHLPIQSGDNEVLGAMRRIYTRESFSEIVKELRETIPQLALTTDIIVGFPGETEEQFENTLNMVSKIRFDGAYMFMYSPRPDTPAATMEQVPAETKKDRLQRLMKLQNTISLEINETYTDRTLEVLVEGVSSRDSNKLQGYSREYKMMHFEGPEHLAGKIVHVQAKKAHLWGLEGEIIS